jgi:hypothetical protein
MMSNYFFFTCKYIYHHHHHHHGDHHHHHNYLCQLILVKNLQLKDRFHVYCLGLNLKISHHCHVCNCWLVSYILCDLRDICMHIYKKLVIIKPYAKEGSYNQSFLVLHFSKKFTQLKWNVLQRSVTMQNFRTWMKCHCCWSNLTSLCMCYDQL